MAIEAVEHTVEVDRCQVRYVSAGQGPPLVLLHGLLGYSFSWRFAIPILARSHEVFAPDMPGSGFSDCSPHLDSRLSAAAGRLAAFLQALNLDKCDLIGSSYGGATALRLATLDRSRIRGLVLVSPANPWSQVGRKRLALLGIPLVAAIFPAVSRRLRPVHGYFVRRMYGDPHRVSEETLRGYSLPLLRPGVLEHAVRITKSWHEDMRQLRDEMPKAAEIPALLVWGSKDRLVDLHSARLLANNFRNCQTVVLEGAGHLPYEEAPEQFCEPVVRFLATHSTAPDIDGK